MRERPPLPFCVRSPPGAHFRCRHSSGLRSLVPRSLAFVAFGIGAPFGSLTPSAACVRESGVPRTGLVHWRRRPGAGRMTPVRVSNITPPDLAARRRPGGRP
ncbi:exported protein of unknown function [Streptantibioticus cattleyicolor NRRL 8057 = DSM 46488]|nr:exported protein of unknown function [Streptantibioticus cattleyicolor NRRL 8057 = DSM 46488]